MAPWVASRPNTSPAMAITASSIGASENTVKNAMAAPKLIARSFHHPIAATRTRRAISNSIL
jgi:hypothetical protein